VSVRQLSRSLQALQCTRSHECVGWGETPGRYLGRTMHIKELDDAPELELISDDDDDEDEEVEGEEVRAGPKPNPALVWVH
jgi:hypothetical protein